jgi:cysteine desulfurase
VQWFGKEPFENVHQFNADLVSICAHKFYGPKGTGALFVKSPLLPDPTLFGGGHENERRAGTENLPGVMGLVRAMELFVHQPVLGRDLLSPLSKVLAEAAIAIKGVQLVGSRVKILANTVGFVVRGADSIALLAGLDLEGICASSGSACSAGSLEPSHVITAIGFDKSLASSLIRFSLGRETTTEDCALVAGVLASVIKRVQRAQ